MAFLTSQDNSHSIEYSNARKIRSLSLSFKRFFLGLSLSEKMLLRLTVKLEYVLMFSRFSFFILINIDNDFIYPSTIFT